MTVNPQYQSEIDKIHALAAAISDHAVALETALDDFPSGHVPVLGAIDRVATMVDSVNLGYVMAGAGVTLLEYIDIVT